MGNALVSYAAYLGQSVCPINLSPFYPHRGIHLPMAWAGGSLLMLVAITAVAASFWRRLPYLLVGWLWFLGMLVPLLGLTGTFLQARADNYTYLPQIGLSIALAWTVWSFYRSQQALPAARWLGWLLSAVAGAAVLALAIVAWRQTSYWRNAETVWMTRISCTPHHALAHYSLATVYAEQGRHEEAILHFREALASYSISRYLTAETHDALADQLAEQRKDDEALYTLRTSCASLSEG